MPLQIQRQKVISAVNVILRVPALFIAEIWYRTDFMKGVKFGSKTHVFDNTEMNTILSTLYFGAVLLAAILMILPLRKLVTLYMYIVCTILILAATMLSHMFVETEQNRPEMSVLESKDVVMFYGYNMMGQGIICALIAYLLELRHWTRFTLLAYTLPIFARIVNIPAEDLHRIQNFSSLFIFLVLCFFIFNHLGRALDVMKHTLYFAYLQTQLVGWISFLMITCSRLLLPMQLLTFWTIMILVQLYVYIVTPNHPYLQENSMFIMLATIAECCATPISLLATCAATSYISYIVISLTKLYLQGWNAYVIDNVLHQGWTEGFTMFLLAIQTDLIQLRTNQRTFLLSVILFIVVSSLIQSIFEVTDPILLSLSASKNKSIVKHAKALMLSCFLWIFPLYMSYQICQYFEIDFWLLVIISSCVLTSVQVLGSILVYSLFLYDALREDPWDKLDDVVYYAKATTRVFEFLVAVFVVVYGVRESLFGSWNWVNVSILTVHFYFNVWVRMQQGWKLYLLRREASAKIESLPDATEAQLEDHDDLCAICYQELRTAKITHCKHYYHALCLRKWLYVQDTCPICHKKITTENIQDASDANQMGPNVNQNDVNNGQEDQNEREEVEENIVNDVGNDI